MTKAFVEGLRNSLRGQVLAPEDPGYEEGRAVYNAMIQRRPGAIARVADAADVIACVHAQARTVRVEGGATWGDVDHATHPFGLAVPCGFISTTGVGGLTLGGGS